MKNNYDVVVVGGGPGGSMAAWEAAKAGLSVCLLDKDRDVGYPVRCGEAIGHAALRQFVEPKDSWIASKITGSTLVAPNGTDVHIEFANETGYILNRRIFDYDLSRYAANAGAEMYTKSFVKDVIIEDDFIKGVKLDHLGESKEITAKIVIGADGIASQVGNAAGLRTLVKMKDMESGMQYSVSNVDVADNKMIMYVGSNYAPGGYLWIFPKGDRFANIGIGIDGKSSKIRSAKSYLDEFMENNFPDAAILTTMCGGIPCPSPMKSPIKNGLMLVGDAARLINPVTGGGIAAAMRSGLISGQIAADAIKNNDCSEKFLNRYTKRVYKEFANNHERLYRIKETIHKLNDDELNGIADKVSAIDPSKRSLGSVFKTAVYKKPSLIIDVLRIFAGF